ncbi:MAG: response regulator [Magnetococcus sp. DMHC-6]
MDNPLSKPSILIVDDAPENLDILKMALINDYIVRPALNGTVALRLATMEPQPDLILLDIMMPGMDGYEVCRQLKKDIRTQDIPVIFVTAKTDDKDELKGLQIGAVDYITKPISPFIVQARVRTHLALRHFNQEMEEKNRRLYEINERLTDSLEQLSASEERFRGLVQTIPDIVYKIDADGRFTFLNKSIERLGYHQSDLIGKHFSEIIHSADVQNACLQDVIHRIGKGNPNPNQKIFDERRTGMRMTMGLEIRLRSKLGRSDAIYELQNIDQHTINVEINSTGLYGDVGQESVQRVRQYIGTVGVIRDITDRLKVQNALIEEKKLLRQVIDAVPHPIFFMEHQGKLIFSNEALQNFTHVKGEDLEGSLFHELFCLQNRPTIEALFTELNKNPALDRIHTEVALKDRLGPDLTMDIILIKFQSSAQTIPAIIGVMVDMSEQKVFTEQLIQARQQAEIMATKADQASRAKGDFLANMSHEIRTPLNAVIGLTHLCMQTELTLKQRDYLTKVSLSANALMQLLNDILDFSKIEAGKLAMEQVGFTLEELLSGVVAVLSLKGQEKGLELLLDIKPNVPPQLLGDSHRLGQILTNLMGNAIKFTKKGEVSLTVDVLKESLNEVTLQFGIADTGIGMTPQQVENLFQEFYQGDASITRKYGGTGLGLAISRRLVEMMQGQMWVTSELGQGSHFVFTAQFIKLANTASPLPIIPKENMRHLRMLVVDDNDSARLIMAAHLETIGYQPECVESGEKAIEKVTAADKKEEPFHVVWMDWKMPGMNGLQTAKRIKTELALKTKPFILMVTAYGQEEISPDPRERGYLDGFLMKPVKRSALLELLMILFGYLPANNKLMNYTTPMPNMTGAKVLLAEDNDINQQVARELLEQVGIQVVIANNGEEALNLLGEGALFDAILMDLQMPVMDGLTATRQIRQKKNFASLPIIAMTANAMPVEREKCLEVGMNDHIAKPVVPEKMYATLAKWLPVQSGEVTKTAFGAKLVEPLPVLAGIDVAKGIRHVGGNIALYRKVLRKFAQNQAGACQEMQLRLANGESKTLESISHSLKGVAATIGATKLAGLAEKIEKQSRIPEGMLELPELLGTTASELAIVISAIETQIESSVIVGNKKILQSVSPEELAPLLTNAMALLENFDASVEKVVEELTPMVAHTGVRWSRLEAIKMALGAYDFEACLELFRDWAKEENIYVSEK